MPSKNVLLITLVCVCALSVPLARAKVSVNVPIGHWSYNALDKLVSLNLINSGLLTTRPMTRLEMARLIREGQANLEEKKRQGASWAEVANAIVRRLQSEFRPELSEFEGTIVPHTYIKPLEDAYVTYFYSDEPFSLENDKGREYSDRSSLNAGFSSHMVFFNHLGLYVNPEYRYSHKEFGHKDYRLSLVEGYGKLEWHNIELEMGRDSLWWGPGHYGSLILTDNAKAFDLVRFSNPNPVLLPWVFKYLGLFRFVGFWTKLGGHREIPNPELMGFRLNVKPFPFLELGACRTLMLGGNGPNAPKGISELSFNDWLKVLSGKNIEDSLDTNQIAGIDFNLHFEKVNKIIPVLRSLDIWGEIYGEDEAANLPSKNGYMLGMRFGDLFLTGKTNLVIEHADNVISGYPSLWYNHHVYRTGYTYYGRVMGHEMDSDARGTWLCLEHYLRPDLILNLDYDHQQRRVQSVMPEKRNRLDFCVRWWKSANKLVGAGYRYESIENIDDLRGNDKYVHVFWLSFSYSL